MPQVSGTYASPRLDLGEAMMEYILDENQFIGTEALSLLPTKKKAASFSKVTRASLLRQRTTARAAKAKYNRDDHEIKDGSYSCEEHGWEELLDDGDRELYATDYDAEEVTAKLAVDVILRNQERRIAALLFNTTTWTGASYFTNNSGTPWSNTATNILSHVLAAIEKSRVLTGLQPNALIVGKKTLNQMVQNDDVRYSIQGVAQLSFKEAVKFLAPYFGVDRILVGDGVTNTANEGQAESLSDIWSNSYAMVARIATTNSIKEPCVGRTWMWTSDSPSNTVIEEYRDETVRSDVFRARHFVDEMVLDKAYAHLMQIN